MGLYVASGLGVRLFADRLTGVRGFWRGYVAGYAPSRWVRLNRCSEEQGLRLEALPHSLPLGSESCLVCVGRTHPSLDRRRQLPELRGLAVGVVPHGGEHDVGQFPLQAAQSFAFGLPAARLRS